MICRTCLRRATAPALRSATPTQALRQGFSTSRRARNAASPAVKVTALTTPAEAAAAGAADAEGKAALSSCVPGTVLKGLNYFKGREDPVALPDEEYPAWLWRCLDVQKESDADADADAGDEFSKSKKQRRLAAKKQRQLEAKLLASGDLEALAPKIPLQQQSINLPGSADGGVEDSIHAAEKREELRKALRKERKAKIKEANYLKSM